MKVLESGFDKLFGDDLIVHIKFQNIPIEPGKKFRWVVNRIKEHG